MGFFIVTMPFLINLGLGEAAKLAASTVSHGNTGYSIEPCADGKVIIKQWGQGLAGTGGTGGEGNTISFPIAFPTACENVIAIYDNGSSTIPAAATSDYTKNSFKLRCSASGGSFNFRWEARGY